MKRFFMLCCLAFLLTACAATPAVFPTLPPPTATVVPVSPTPVVLSATPEPSAMLEASLTPRPLEVRFAVIGDFGMDNQAEADVSALIHGWAPDIVITVGDDNYPSGAADTLDANVGKYFHDFIFPYTGAYGTGADVNRFFPTLGNHDWITDGAQPYFDYFTLPGNERYYDFVWGPVHFFALDSDDRELDGVGRTSVQAAWLQAGVVAAGTSSTSTIRRIRPALTVRPTGCAGRLHPGAQTRYFRATTTPMSACSWTASRILSTAWAVVKSTSLYTRSPKASTAITTVTARCWSPPVKRRCASSFTCAGES
jgi:hypothetical protein